MFRNIFMERATSWFEWTMQLHDKWATNLAHKTKGHGQQGIMGNVYM